MTTTTPAPEPDHLIRTEDTATEAELRDLFADEDDEGPLGDLHETHDGEWRREGDLWRWYQSDDEFQGFNLGRDADRVVFEPALTASTATSAEAEGLEPPGCPIPGACACPGGEAELSKRLGEARRKLDDTRADLALANEELFFLRAGAQDDRGTIADLRRALAEQRVPEDLVALSEKVPQGEYWVNGDTADIWVGNGPDRLLLARCSTGEHWMKVAVFFARLANRARAQIAAQRCQL